MSSKPQVAAFHGTARIAVAGTAKPARHQMSTMQTESLSRVVVVPPSRGARAWPSSFWALLRTSTVWQEVVIAVQLQDSPVREHEHQWTVVYVEYDEATPSNELRCPCGEVSFSAT